MSEETVQDVHSVSEGVPETIDSWPFEFEYEGQVYEVHRPNPAWVQDQFDQNKNPQKGVMTTQLLIDVYENCFVPKEEPESKRVDLEQTDDYQFYSFVSQFVGRHFLGPVIGNNPF